MRCAQPEDATTLCVSCGLCCNGVLYNNVKASLSELSPAESSGLAGADDQLQFPLPCPHHQGGCCAIYATRFAKCRSFRCALLKRLEAGEIDLPEALDLVSRAKAMVAQVATLDPSLELSANRSARRREALPASGEIDRDAARLSFEIVVLDRFLDRVFRNEPAIDVAPL